MARGVPELSIGWVNPRVGLDWVGSGVLPERDYVTFGSLLSQFCLSSVCLSSVTLVHPTQGVEFFGKISLLLYIRWPFSDLRAKFYGDSPGGTPPPEALKRKRGIKIERFWTYRKLYLINGTR